MSLATRGVYSKGLAAAALAKLGLCAHPLTCMAAVTKFTSLAHIPAGRIAVRDHALRQLAPPSDARTGLRPALASNQATITG
jgi:hypothetical protein